MNLLAIDTSTEYLSLAVEVKGRSCDCLLLVGNKQSINIIPKITQLLKQCDATIGDIDAIIYNCGPGSFTGLRIGLSVAKGIALGLGIPLIPVPCFDVFAYGYACGKLDPVSVQNLSIESENLISHKHIPYNENSGHKIIVALDARLDQVYIAGVNLQPHHEYFLGPQVVAPRDLPHIENVYLIGYKISDYISQFPDCYKYGYFDVMYPNPSILISIVKADIITKRYKYTNASDANLLYLRNKVALNKIEQAATKNF
jgi:tRNA threonylcarbamoyladenosine biosynthesis protein TsaB